LESPATATPSRLEGVANATDGVADTGRPCARCEGLIPDPRAGQLYCSSRCRGPAWRAAREAEPAVWLRDLRAVHEASGRLLARADQGRS
jgi:hypothetical protein